MAESRRCGRLSISESLTCLWMNSHSQNRHRQACSSANHPAIEPHITSFLHGCQSCFHKQPSLGIARVRDIRDKCFRCRSCVSVSAVSGNGETRCQRVVGDISFYRHDPAVVLVDKEVWRDGNISNIIRQ